MRMESPGGWFSGMLFNSIGEPQHDGGGGLDGFAEGFRLSRRLQFRAARMDRTHPRYVVPGIPFTQIIAVRCGLGSLPATKECPSTDFNVTAWQPLVPGARPSPLSFIAIQSSCFAFQTNNGSTKAKTEAITQKLPTVVKS